MRRLVQMEGLAMNKITSAEYLQALDDDVQDDDVYTDAGPAEELLDQSEAERMAAAAEPPRQRADGQPVGMEGWKRQRPLTENQMAFVRGVIEGKSYRQAYRDAYPNAQANDQSIASSAWKLSKDPRVQRLIQAGEEEQQEHLAEDVAATRRFVMRRLLGLSKAARQEGSQLKALELLGRAAGMWRDVQTQSDKPVTAADLKAALAGHLRLVSTSRKRVDVESVQTSGAGVQTGDVQTRVA